MKKNKQDVALIGAGISGLASLYFLLKTSVDEIATVEIFEKENHIGGVLNNTKANGFLLEHGAQGVLSTREGFKSLIADLSLENECVATVSKTAHRWFFFKNRVIKIAPSNLIQMFRVRLLSLRMLLRLFFEIFVQKPETIQKNETVSNFFARRFGSQFVSNFVNPVMKGIWGGGTTQILMRFAFPKLQEIEQEHSSLLKYFFKNIFKKKNKNEMEERDRTSEAKVVRPKKEILSFKDGMQTLPLKLLSVIEKICASNNIELKVHLNCNAVTIGRNTMSVLVHDEQGQEQILNHTMDILIYSGQPWRDQTLKFELPNDHTALAYETLKNIVSNSLVVVGIGSSCADVSEPVLEGFGALAVEDNAEGVLGVICVHSLQKDHVPQKSFLYRVLMNLDARSDAEFIQSAKKYLEKHHLLQVNRTYHFEHIVRHEHFLPLPMSYQDAVIEAVETLEREIPGVFFAGNYILGPSVENCVAQAQQTAQKISQYFLRNKN